MIVDPLATMLWIAREYTGTHLYTRFHATRVHCKLSFGVPRTRDQEFFLFHAKDGFAGLTYCAYPDRARQTFGPDLEAGSTAGFLERLQQALDEFEQMPHQLSKIEASMFAFEPTATQEFIAAAYRVMRSRTH